MELTTEQGVPDAPPAPGRSPSPEVRPGIKRRRRRDTATALAFLTPSLVAFTLFVIIPAVAMLVLSLYSWDLFNPAQWVGLENFRRLFSDDQVWTSLRVTVEFVVLGVVPTVIVGFMLASLINTRMRGIGAIRLFYFAPLVASSAVAAVLWSYMYDPRAGIVNRIAGWFGIGGRDWLTDTTWALPAVVLMLIWLALPLVTILYLAGLQRIPEDIYSAAALDGAGAWRRLWQITWPNVAGTTVLIAVLQMINFISSSFETSLIMTNGGPLGHTQTITLYAYKTAFGSNGSGDLGYASALSLFQLAFVGIIAGLVQLVRIYRARTS